MSEKNNKLAGSSASINPRLFAVNFQRAIRWWRRYRGHARVCAGGGGKMERRDGADTEMEGGNGRPTQTQQHRLPLPEALVTTRTSGSPPSLPGSLEHRLGGKDWDGEAEGHYEATRLGCWSGRPSSAL